MLCIPVSSESRTLARVDLLNASRSADLVELCLDRFQQRPDVAELMAGIEKPIIVSCRRTKDGGFFEGSEAERLRLLQESLAAKPAYLELELEIASQIPRTADTKRLISVNRPFRALTDLAALQRQAEVADADVVKYVWPGLLIDSLAPILTTLKAGPSKPIVGLPIGYAGRSFPLLAKRYGAPWVYGALERGMETHDGMPTFQELTEQFGLAGINRQTRLIGAVGFGTVRARTVATFNAACLELGLNCRCIPLEVGPVETLKEVLSQLEMTALVVTPGLGDYLQPMVMHPEPAAALGANVDLLLEKKDGWHGYNVLWRSLLKVVDRTLKRQHPQPLSLEQTKNIVIGAGRLARTILFGLRQLHGDGLLTSPGPDTDEIAFCPSCGEALTAPDESVELARTLDAKSIPFAEVVAARPDVLFIASPDLHLGFSPRSLNPLFLQPPLVVADTTTLLGETDILVEARQRGCHVVRPSYVLAEHLATQFKALTGHDLPDAAFQLSLDLAE